MCIRDRFEDAERLAILNDIVHGAVRNAIKDRAQNCRSDIFFIETAIMFSSVLNMIVDAEWLVTAPLKMRVGRVMKRNGLSEAEVLSRIEAQKKEEEGSAPFPPRKIIVNDLVTPLLPQLWQALH